MSTYFLSCLGNILNLGLLSNEIKFKVNSPLFHIPNPIMVSANLRSSYSREQTEQYVIHLTFIFLGKYTFESEHLIQ